MHHARQRSGSATWPGRKKPPLLIGCTLIFALACKGDPKFFFEKKPLPEVPYQGFRRDIPDERRGNALFDRAVYTADGTYLVTAGSGFRVWDPRTGVLLRRIPATLDRNDPLVVDGVHHRLLAKRNVAPTSEEAPGLGIWDLRNGSMVGLIPESLEARAVPVGTTRTGLAVVLTKDAFETWSLDGSGRQRVITAPPALGATWPACIGGMPATYNDKHCWELSPSGRWIAVAATPSEPLGAHSQYFLVDVESGDIRPIEIPAAHLGDHLAAFAFSADERTLAVGLSSGLLIVPVEGTPGAVAPLFIPGQHQRNNYLGGMAFTAGDTRVIALGDQLQLSTFDVATGALVGRTAPPFSDFEGVLRVAASGSRVVAYRFVSDILVIIDGASGVQRGYVCPYFCNRFHNPVEVHFAVSPNGRRVAVSRRDGAGIFDVDADTLIAPLNDLELRPRVSK